MKKHGGGFNVGLLIPALEALEESRGGEACLGRSATINSARRGWVDLWGRGSKDPYEGPRFSRSGRGEINPKRNF